MWVYTNTRHFPGLHEKKSSQLSCKEQAVKEQISLGSASVPAFRFLPQVPLLTSLGDELLPGKPVRNKPLLSQVSFCHSNRKLTNNRWRLSSRFCYTQRGTQCLDLWDSAFPWPQVWCHRKSYKGVYGQPSAGPSSHFRSLHSCSSLTLPEELPLAPPPFPEWIHPYSNGPSWLQSNRFTVWRPPWPVWFWPFESCLASFAALKGYKCQANCQPQASFLKGKGASCGNGESKFPWIPLIISEN